MLKLSALALPTSWLAQFSSALSTASAASGSKPLPEWVHFNRTLINEAYNPPFYPSFDYEPKKAVSIAQALDCDSMRYPATSYYAYFPTKSGYPVHPELKGDPMRETLELLRKANLHTIAYIPLNHPFMSAESKDPRYPNWTRRNIDGSPMTTAHYGFDHYFEGCLNSPIREMVMKMTSEVLDYDYDVLYFDGPYEGMDHARDFCYCEHCQAAYRKRFGRSVPDQHTCSSEERIQYIYWMRDEVVLKFFRDLRTMISAQRDVPVLFNDTALLSKLDWRAHAIPIADGFMFEAADTPEAKLFNLQLGKSTDKVIWTYVSHHTQYNREHMTDKAARGWFSYPVEGQELLLDGAVATAAGVGCVYWGMQRFFYMQQDPLSFESGRHVKDIFTFQQQHAPLLRTLSARPQVGVLVGSQTIDWYKGKIFEPSAYGNYYHGAFDLLKSLSIESEPFLDWWMTPELLRRYSMVYVPNAACLSDAQCTMLRHYAEEGGTLVCSHLTSVADEHGRVRKDFGLADVFGASYVEPEPFEYPDLYLKPNGADSIPQDVQIMRIRATSGAVQATTHDRGNRRDLGPAVVTKAIGKGHSIYLASGLEAIFEETRMETIRAYMGSLLLTSLEDKQSYKMDYISGVTPHLMASDKCIVLHLLANVSDADHHFKTRQTFFPVENITVRIRVPRSVASVTLLRAGTTIPMQQQGNWIAVTVPRVLIYEAIRVDLA
jgi:hypothetical protein